MAFIGHIYKKEELGHGKAVNLEGPWPHCLPLAMTPRPA